MSVLNKIVGTLSRGDASRRREKQVSGRVAPKAEYSQKTGSRKSDPRYVVGIEPRDGTEVKLLVDERLHLLCTGFPGTGKSTFFLSQMLQDIKRGESVFLFDPHGDLARRLLTHIPKERWGDVVYVNPLTAWDHSRVVRFNFLERRKSLHEGLVTRMFMDALKKNYPGFWGPRLDVRQDPEEPKLVLAFHRDLSRSRGTADMVKRARLAGVKVRVIS